MKILICGLLLIAAPAFAQSKEDGPVLAALALEPTASFKFFQPAGSIRLFGWDKDSIVVRGRGSRRDFSFGGNEKGGKLFIDDPAPGTNAKPINLVVYYPRRGSVYVKGANIDIAVTDVAGWFATVSGTISARGSASSLEVESMSGNVLLDATVPWVRVRTGQGRLLIRGAPQDVDASTVGGALEIATSSILRGRFSSVTGDIRYAATPDPGLLADFSNHAGTVDFLLPRTVSGRFDLSSVSGEIANGFTQVRPASAGPHQLRVNLGRGEARITARTFKGTIRLRPEAQP